MDVAIGPAVFKRTDLRNSFQEKQEKEIRHEVSIRDEDKK